MVCTTIQLPGGVRGIVCGPRARLKRCSCCGTMGAERLCDWKLDEVQGKRKDCDRPICQACSTVPAIEKDLCREHGEEWGRRMAAALMLQPMRNQPEET